MSNRVDGTDEGVIDGCAPVEASSHEVLNRLNSGWDDGIQVFGCRPVVRLTITNVDLAPTIPGESLLSKVLSRMPDSAIVLGPSPGSAGCLESVLPHPELTQEGFPRLSDYRSISLYFPLETDKGDFIVELGFLFFQSGDVVFKRLEGSLMLPFADQADGEEWEGTAILKSCRDLE